jgi:hypothetical protein
MAFTGASANTGTSIRAREQDPRGNYRRYRDLSRMRTSAQRAAAAGSGAAPSCCMKLIIRCGVTVKAAVRGAS